MKKIIPAAIIIISLMSCSQSRESKSKEDYAKADTTANAFISSSAAVEKNKDTTRKFIRTAELKFKVKSVLKSTYAIEDLTSQQGGFVTYTKLSSTVDYVSTIPVSADSSLETTFYTVSNSIILRIPNTKLDSTLKQISKNIDYLDYRIIKADDVGLQILSNNLTQKRAANNEERLTTAIDKRGKKLNETTIAEEVLLSKQEQANSAKIANMSLTDQIKFSTINLSIYQRQTVKRELITNNKNTTAFEPNFGSKMVEAFKFGWNIFVEIILILIRIWWLFLFAIISYIIYKRYTSRRK